MNLEHTREIQFTRRRLQHEYKHAADFGIAGSCNKRSLLAFEAALRQHVEAGLIIIVSGSFRGVPVTHFLSPVSRLDVMRDMRGQFLAAWRLRPLQFRHVLNGGKLGGGQ